MKKEILHFSLVVCCGGLRSRSLFPRPRPKPPFARAGKCGNWRTATEKDPATALADLLTAACRANQTEFSNYLTGDNGAAFRALPETQRTALMKRLSLAEAPVSRCFPRMTTITSYCFAGRRKPPWNSGSARPGCTKPGVHSGKRGERRRSRFRAGARSGRMAAAFPGVGPLGRTATSKEWAQQDLAAREDAIVETLHSLAEAIQTYRNAFGKLPESLAELGPAPPNQISPEQASLVSANLAAGKQGGYVFRYRIAPDANGNDNDFELAATPQSYGKMGRRSFFMDIAGKIHGADKHGAVATYEDPLIAGEKAPVEKSE